MDDELPPLVLADMRLVYLGEAAQTPAQRKLKVQYEKKPDRFMERLEALERRWAMREQARFKAEVEKKPVKEAVTETVDEGSQVAKAVLEEFLRGLS